MTSRLTPTASFLALALFASLPALGDDPKVEGDMKALQGEWISKDDQGNESKWTFKGDKLSLKAHPDREYSITIKLDDKAKPEKAIEFAVAEDSKNAKGFKAPGIYKFDGEKKVSICFAADGQGRPKDFKTDGQTQFNFDLVKK